MNIQYLGIPKKWTFSGDIHDLKGQATIIGDFSSTQDTIPFKKALLARHIDTDYERLQERLRSEVQTNDRVPETTLYSLFFRNEEENDEIMLFSSMMKPPNKAFVPHGDKIHTGTYRGSRTCRQSLEQGVIWYAQQAIQSKKEKEIDLYGGILGPSNTPDGKHIEDFKGRDIQHYLGIMYFHRLRHSLGESKQGSKTRIQQEFTHFLSEANHLSTADQLVLRQLKNTFLEQIINEPISSMVALRMINALHLGDEYELHKLNKLL